MRRLLASITLCCALAAPWAACAQIAPVRGYVADIIEQAASAAGLPVRLMQVIAQIESGGDRTAVTGSYKGIYQLSDSLFRQLGGTGNILDAHENVRVAMIHFGNLLADFRDVHARDPDPTELYLAHQQGLAGLTAHLGKPEGIAWRNVRPFYSDQEGRRRGFADGDAYAKAAIWGNVPSDVRKQFAGVDQVTSAAFVEVWRNKVEGPPRELRLCVAADGRFDFFKVRARQ